MSVLSDLFLYSAIVPKSDRFNWEKGNLSLKELRKEIEIKFIVSVRKIYQEAVSRYFSVDSRKKTVQLISLLSANY